MNNDKYHNSTTTPTGGGSIGGLVHIVNNHRNSSITSPTLNSTRTHSPPLMGTSARAAKRRMDGDTGPLRIDGTDTYNQQLQHHYQNVRQVLEEQQPNQITNIDQSTESRQSFSTKRDFFEQQLKSTSVSTYDSPPREQKPAQKIITTITTTTTTQPTPRNQPNSLLNESSPSVDQLFEQAAELQKYTNINPTKTDSQQPLIIERTEQYQVFLDPKIQELRRTSTLPITKTNHTTDIDQTQTQHVDRFVDDHQAIQKLTRVLQEHNTSAVNELKRLPSQSNSILINTTTTTTTTIPSNIVLIDRSKQPITSEFTVIDALLDNPLGTNNNKQNNALHIRFNDILSNLRNAEYVNVLKQSTAKITKKKKSKNEKTSKEKKKQEKENKRRNKIKSKKLSKTKDYHVIDAIINSPIVRHLPDSYLAKYKVSSPRSQLSSVPSITGKDNIQQLDTKVKNETVHNNLVNIVSELKLHNAAALTTSTTNELQRSTNPIYLNQVHPGSNQFQTQLQSSESNKPRIVYRYIDEQGNVLKISPTPPSQLHVITPEESRQTIYRNTDPTYFHSRQIAVDDERHHFIPGREQRTTWQDESKLPTTVTREDLELRDKRIPKLSEQPLSTTRSIPILIEREHSLKRPFQEQQQQRIYQHPNQQNVQLTWLPLSYQLDKQYIPSGGTAGYDSDSTTSEDSPTYRPYDYAPFDTHHRYNHRPLFQSLHYQSHSPVRSYYPSPSRLSYGNRHISPDYSGNSVSRNYIEVFRDGELKPSEVYSLPFKESVSPNHRHSRYDKYQSEKYGKKHVPSSSPHAKRERSIPSLSNHGPYTSHTNSNFDPVYFDNYIRQSKSSEYRPLRTKLQREYKITPSLLVDEWDHPYPSGSTDYNKQTSLRWHVGKSNKKPSNGTNGHTEQQTLTSRHELIDSTRQKPEYKTQTRLPSQPIYKALALHSFYAQTSRELSFKKGDILLVLRRINDDWLEGDYQGSIGIFPLNHVELFPIEQEDESNDSEKEQEIQGEAIVKYDFIPQKTFELQLRKGDKVILLRKLDNNWYEGRLNHIEGIFPAAYVETLREPPDVLSKKPHQNGCVEPEKQTSPDSEQITPTEKIDITQDLSLPLQKCQVLYDYTPQNPDELEIHVGDIINIIEMCDDGWYCGIMEKSNHKNTMEFGTFPGNYVKLLPT